MSDRDPKSRLAGLSAEQRAALFEKLAKRKAAAAPAAGTRAEAGVRSPIPLVERGTAGTLHPLSFAQERLWFLFQYDPESPEYNIPQGFRLAGDLDLDVLARSLAAIVGRHEVLRTTYRQVDEEPRQAIHPPAPVELPVVDVAGAADPLAAALALATEDAQAPFDLTTGPLLRARLYRLAPDDHLLYVNVHHVAYDGWSRGLFLAELAALYEGLHAGGGPVPGTLPELPVQYLDFGAWQREHLSGERLERHMAYWRRQLGDVPALELPTDRPRAAVREWGGSTHRFALGEALTERLRALASASDATLFITLLAAFRALLWRYTGQGSVGVGTLIANRARSEAEPLVGFFANTLVLRTAAGDDPSFRELVARERETALDAYGRQDLPFEKLVEELEPRRDLARTPLFQAMFILQNAPAGDGALRLPGLEVVPVGVDSRTAKTDLTLYLTDGDALEGFFEYSTSLFDPATVERMAEHLRRLLEGAAAHPDARLSTLPILTEDERRTLIDQWNATARPVPEPATVHGRFAARAAERPGAEAVTFEGASLTYGELAGRVRRLAGHLGRLGVGPGDLVGVFLERSLDMVVAVLGVLEAGAAYVPLDPEYPQDRIAYMLESSRAPVVLTQSALVETLPAVGLERRLVALDADWPAIAAGDEKATDAPAAGPDDLAYVIYTSGSTGKPKGVQVPHRAVANFLDSMAEAPGFGSEDTLFAVTTLSFDIAGLELYLPLVRGGRVVVASRETAQAGEELVAAVRASGATVMQATPATWRLLLDAGWTGPPPARILCGGEALPRELADRLLATGVELWNMYGPTEATIWSAVTRVPAGPEAVPVGGPIANTELYVVDPALAPQPVGVPGELLIGGLGLARGYVDRPGLTAERFVPDPFGARAGGRLYRTGDLVRWRPDGRLAFMGRIDHQVKVRGFRIELGEIEAVLATHPEVEQPVVIVREDRPGDKRLAAYFVIDPEREPPRVAALRSYLKERLPEYMVPPIFIGLEALPLTPNGKVDRKALPAPDRNRPELGEEYVAPRNPTEAALAAIWSEVLELERIGVNDDFFDLGGDSLLVIRVVAKANKAELGVTTKQVFQNRTIAELATVAGTTDILAEQGPVTGPTPWTPAQLHFLELGHPNPHWHSLGALLEIDGVLDADAVAEALVGLARQHDNLRVRLDPEATGGERRLVTDPPWETVPLERVDLSGKPEDQQQAGLRDTVFALTKSFDLERGPLFKAATFDLGPGKVKAVFLIAHFLAADVSSWHTLLDDFDLLYRERLAGREPELPAKTTAAAQWAGRLAERAAGEEIRHEVPFWLAPERRLATPLPLDFPDGVNLFGTARNVQVRFDPEETRGLLLTLPRKLGIQIDGLLMATILSAFREWTGGESFLVDLLGHGREAIYDDTDLTRTVGWLNTIFPVLLEPGSAATEAERLVEVNRQLRSIPNGGLGYGLLRYLARDPELIEGVAALPQPDIFFNYFGPDNTAELATFRKADGWGGFVLDKETIRLRPLAIGVYIKHDRMLIKWEYSEALHRRETIAALAEHSEAMLRRLLATLGIGQGEAATVGV